MSGNAALAINEMKLILGDPGTPDGWIPPPAVTDSDETNHSHSSSACKKKCISRCLMDPIAIRLFNLTGKIMSSLS